MAYLRIRMHVRGLHKIQAPHTLTTHKMQIYTSVNEITTKVRTV